MEKNLTNQIIVSTSNLKPADKTTQSHVNRKFDIFTKPNMARSLRPMGSIKKVKSLNPRNESFANKYLKITID